jgi:hypothetical protein
MNNNETTTPTDNLFDFSYQVETVYNRDAIPAKTNEGIEGKPATKSRFAIVCGQKGMVIATKKDSYTVVTTEALSEMGKAFEAEGLKVSPYTHKYGEVIGLSVVLGNRPTKVGDKLYKAIVRVPNNGTGCGEFYIDETRLVCLNGMVRKISGTKGTVKIPHDLSYPQALSIVQDAILAFKKIVSDMEKQDERLAAVPVTTTEMRVHLNQWFYNNEVSDGQKKDLATLDQFRKAAFNKTLANSVQNRYDQLETAIAAELEHNETLGLGLTKYTTFAVVTNYISRRNEAGNSKAPNEERLVRLEKKIKSAQSILA